MLIVSCPQCGGPTRVALASPDTLLCRRCGYHGPPDSGVQGELHAAAHTLTTLDRRFRQLTTTQRRLLVRERSSRFRLIFLFSLLFGPFLLCAISGMVFLLGRRAYPELSIICAGPMVFFGCVAGTLLLLRIRYRRRLESACAALPPPEHGGPAECRVCGGPLPAAEVSAGTAAEEAFVRCSYCDADNLVAPDVLRRMAKRSHGVIVDINGEVRKEGTRLGYVSGLSTLTVIAVGLLAPLSCCALSYGMSQWLWTVERPVDETDRYLLVESSKGPCIARVNKRLSDGSAHLILYGTRKPDRSANYVAGAARETPFSALAVAGTSVLVTTPQGSKPGRVLRVYKAPLDPANRAVVQLEGGRTHWAQLNALCYRTPPAGFAVVPWPQTSRFPRGARLLD